MWLPVRRRRQTYRQALQDVREHVEPLWEVETVDETLEDMTTTASVTVVF